MTTAKEKMLRGELYMAWDEELVEERRRARRLLAEYNKLTFAEEPEAERVRGELLGSVGSGVFLEMPFRCDYGYNIHLADDVYMNFDCVLLDGCEIRIGARTMLAPGVHIYAATHPLDPDVRASGLELCKPVTIGEDVWIGGGAIVLPGVTIGDRAVVGAGSVVTKDVAPLTVVAGNPARVIRTIERDVTNKEREE